jgi:hypothetical protein
VHYAEEVRYGFASHARNVTEVKDRYPVLRAVWVIPGSNMKAADFDRLSKSLYQLKAVVLPVA